MAALDFSSPADENHVVDTEGLVSEDALGTLGKDGSYEVADWDFRRGPGSKGADNDGLPSEDEILARGAARMGISAKSVEKDEEVEAEGVWASMFSRIQGKKFLSHEDLKPVLVEMEKHLMSKNVAKDIAEKLCEGVGSALAGKKLSGFSSTSFRATSSADNPGIKSQVQAALSNSITRILTPKTSTDLLLDIRRKRSQPSSLIGDSKPDPFTITFVGVNGVGKSTNLSKVCFWLLQNKYRVLIAACDTFRSGAVEQLRVHVRNLGALGEQMGMGEDGKRIELYERGYGKDAAGIAKDAIAYGGCSTGVRY
jgi:signal recognition particle receptor subunit alpha